MCLRLISAVDILAVPCGRCLRRNLLLFFGSDVGRPNSFQAANESFRLPRGPSGKGNLGNSYAGNKGLTTRENAEKLGFRMGL